ncbi:20501_t:CDS:1, partial [Funneliformis geosporum]
LDYQNKKDIFKAESLNSSKLTKNPLRYWQTILLHTSNLAEFAYRLFSISLNSATSER